jgi:hypothetical protein
MPRIRLPEIVHFLAKSRRLWLLHWRHRQYFGRHLELLRILRVKRPHGASAVDSELLGSRV